MDKDFAAQAIALMRGMQVKSPTLPLPSAELLDLAGKRGNFASPQCNPLYCVSVDGGTRRQENIRLSDHFLLALHSVLLLEMNGMS